MNSLQDKAAATGANAEIPVVVARRSKSKMIGVLLCVSAVVVVAATAHGLRKQLPMSALPRLA